MMRIEPMLVSLGINRASKAEHAAILVGKM
jgi:hypothetical protein